MSKKNGAARAEVSHPEKPLRAGDRFSVYADRVSGDRFRRYCLKHGITFTELALSAIEHFIAHCEPPKRKTLDLPRGSRLRFPRQLA